MLLTSVFCALKGLNEGKTQKEHPLPLKRILLGSLAKILGGGGGVTQEIAVYILQQSLCEGKENCLVPRHDATKLQVLPPFVIKAMFLNNCRKVHVFSERQGCR